MITTRWLRCPKAAILAGVVVLYDLFPIVEMMLSLSNQLETAFSRNRISNDSISKAVPNFVGVVASLTTLHKKTFEKFASHTQLGY